MRRLSVYTGGATVAALLEKAARAGGKTQTTERKGYRFEMFGAVGIPAFNSRFHELVDTLGIAARTPFVVPEGNAASMRYLNKDGQWKVSYNPLMPTGSEQEMTTMKDTLGVTDAELEAMGAFYGEILSLSDDDISALDHTGAYAWMERFNMATPLVSQICMNLNTLFVVAVDRLPASEMIFALRDQVLGGAGRYHIGGYGHVAEVCALTGVTSGPAL